ncbi:cation:proton antiporter regulatory subunit [Alkalihalobacterium chitinilyticum]|uniref:Cation:proton antiporter regulatory subunit n=1 Tax=Alkalihalobacterium chitinilyticum TaxID=2980103 RepID=A0ABT5VKA1_9BACI|nr:cation:proton antiporter regulatory subunit [Alkalihalobacterium chitinilyticum]MDE5415636.1 cation:proton antiporter regulatory subunit [Alkalihalobacterium chitinilyticum]
MQVKMADLPGIGKKMSFITAEGNMIVLVIHHSGKREMYFFIDPDDDEADFSINLTAGETRELGAQLLGAVFQPVDSDTMKLFKSQIVMEWIKVKEGSIFAGKTIAQNEIRKRTGVSIVGIFRNDDVIASPEPHQMLEVGDTLMAIGKNEQIKEFERISAGGAM